jgi:hypothetical protein
MINVEDGATADQTKSDIDGLAITTVGTLDTGNATAIVSAASTSAAGKVELATTAETLTGTSTTLAVTPDGLKDGFKHRQIVNLKGYCTLTTNYQFAQDYLDNQAPWDISQNYGSGTIGSGTEVNQSLLFRAGGFHVPFACDVNTIQVQVSDQPGSGGGNITVAIVEYRPSNAGGDTSDYPRTVYEAVAVSASDSNNKINTTTVTSGDLDNTSIPAGSHLLIFVKGDADTSGDDAFISASIEITW